MIGGVVFIIVFVLLTVISLVIDLPPGIWIHDWFNVPASEYSSLINALVNGVIYGIIIWLCFSLAKIGRKKESVKLSVLEEEVRELLESEPREPKRPIELTDIKGIGPENARKLKTAGVNTVSDLAKRSAKNLSEKTGISIKIISKWIVRANEMAE